ncbi:hypothetical protein PV797_07385 [Clostridiaceae bacterium M8S5]|nr:hypothetical protein PV797_07385 [Clostridiaceae bacterium M8S5]
MRKSIINIFIIIGITLILLVSFFTYHDYTPNSVEKINIRSKTNMVKKIDKSVIDIMTWNIGFGVLNRDVDYFTAGGKIAIAKSKSDVYQNLEGILKIMNSKPVDFYVLQEVDIKSKRSKYINEYEYILNSFRESCSAYAINYKVKFVPYPIFNELGSVKSGLVTIGKYSFNSAYRYNLPGNYIWPVRTLMPDRCILVTDCDIEGKKEKLYIINIHNSAFDRNAKNRKKQIEYIKNFMLEKYREGNYVVVGGDWNLIFNRNTSTYRSNPSELIPYNWNPEGWKWAVDYKVPTNRKLRTAYDKKRTRVKVIDGFLVSPNINVIKVKGIDHEFRYSDHNPVLLRIELK